MSSSLSTNGCGGWLCLVVLLIVVCSRVPYSTASRVVVNNALWDTETVNARRGTNVTLVCRLQLGDDMGGIIGYPPVFRIVHSHAERTLLVADNDNLTSPFVRLGRYDILYTPPPADDGSSSSSDDGDRFAELVVKINGVQGEDSGTLACQQLNNDENIAYCDLLVYAAVDEIYITSISPSTGNETRVPDGSDAVLRESVGAVPSSSGGVGCTAVVNRGGYRTIPPQVSVVVVLGTNGDDVVNATSWFQTTVDTRHTVTDSGLSVYRIVSRLVFVPDRPDAELNGRTIKCIARSEGFEDNERLAAVATARLVVHYIPAILCPTTNVTATVGAEATFTCTIKSNPVSEITWSALARADEQYDVNDDVNVRFISKALSEDEVDVSLSIVNVQPHHFRLFRIRASNSIGDVTTSIKLVPGMVVTTVTEPESTTTARTVVVTTREERTPVVVMETVAAIVKPDVDFEEQEVVEVELLPDRQQSMQNDAAVVSGDEKPSTRSSQLAPSTEPTASINSAMPVRAKDMDTAISSTSSLSSTPSVTYLSTLFVLVTFVALSIPRLTAF